MVKLSYTFILSLFYHQSGIVFRGAGSKSTCVFSVPKPCTIADDMVSHHVITLVFVLLATRSIQKTVPSVGWYILPPKAKTVVSLLGGFTLTLENQ